jgi:hypothetical protein
MKMVDVMACVCDPSYTGGINKRIVTLGKKKHETLSEKITRTKKGWRHGCIGRRLASVTKNKKVVQK